MDLTFEGIKKRWRARFIRSDQLRDALDLEIITQTQYDQLWAEKYGPPVIEVPVEEPPAEEIPEEPDAPEEPPVEEVTEA